MNTNEKTVSEWVATDYRTAAVFKKYGIDFCCNGNRSVEDACGKNEINPDQIRDDLREVILENRSGDSGINYNSWPLDLLADYIEKKHHRYINAQAPVIKDYLAKLCRAHGQKHPELLEVSALFNSSIDELEKHMKKEEEILFPLIRNRVVGREGQSLISIESIIGKMTEEHETEGKRFRQISALAHHYQAPLDGCNTYKVAFSLLKEFEDDLHLHIHLENNILFPKAIELEKTNVQHN